MHGLLKVLQKEKRKKKVCLDLRDCTQMYNDSSPTRHNGGKKDSFVTASLSTFCIRYFFVAQSNSIQFIYKVPIHKESHLRPLYKESRWVQFKSSCTWLSFLLLTAKTCGLVAQDGLWNTPLKTEREFRKEHCVFAYFWWKTHGILTDNQYYLVFMHIFSNFL